MERKSLIIILILSFALQFGHVLAQTNEKSDTLFCGHRVVIDNQGKILPWYFPQEKAYDHFLNLRWDFIKTKVPNSPGPGTRSNYPQYYFYCGFKNNTVADYDTWMNDVGEKIPNWFENARLYYAYTGDTSVMAIVKGMIDYCLSYGTSPESFAWPNFPYTTTNAGNTIFQGFTSASRFQLHEIQVDHAGEMGLTYFRLYLYTGETRYLAAAIDVANVLASYARTGTAEKSVWPYRVIMKDGTITAEYGANWTGCYMLFDNLIKAGLGDINKYSDARNKVKNFILDFPVKTGYWTDGHSDTDVKSNTYKSNLSASNMVLCMFDYPELNPKWKSDFPKLIKWTEDYFVFRSAPGEPSTMWGANIVGEQDMFMHKMDYQTARYAAECARWYAISADVSYKEKAYRALNWVTYCNNSEGMAFESPVSKGISTWWSDCYGECPRMFYHVFAAIPEWAPAAENHILYSEGILKNVEYGNQKVVYTATKTNDTEYLRLAFKPSVITLNGNKIPLTKKLNKEGFTLRNLENGDFAVAIKRASAGKVIIEK
jgi:hypothetical protein